MYRIWIKTDKHGSPGVGADSIDEQDVVASERIFPSQMPHRCTARNDKDEVIICTPTYAQAQGYDVLAHYPVADGSLARRNR
jgi:hypothetical protein